jgi:hypothetical protein
VTFGSFLETISVLCDAERVVAGEGPPSRDEFVRGCLEAARALAGNEGVDTFQEALAEFLSAIGLVNRFGNPAVIAKNQEDGNLCAAYNYGQYVLDAYLVCLYESPQADLASALKAELLEKTALLCRHLCGCAIRAAELRGISTTFDPNWVVSIWPDPTDAYANFLVRRAPEAIMRNNGDTEFSADVVEAAAENHQLDTRHRLSESCRRLSEGQSIASVALLRAIENAGVPDADVEDLDAWADGLANDLAAFSD